MPKRKASQLETGLDTNSMTLRRSTRRKSQLAPPSSPPPPPPQEVDASSSAIDPTRQTDKKKKTEPKPRKAEKPQKETVKAPPKPQAKTTKPAKASKPASGETSTTSAKAADSPEKSYWLMKAEPESRFENGTDVKFSIDDLASRTEPEPWDGIRAYAARNNLRSMKKGELAFFYHSNCKEPGIVGTMEIVEEHSPDVSAHDPKAPYYDASSKPEDPKWSVVHVKFRSKFAQPIGLKELREFGKPGQPLENMQLLKQSRLSVSRVSPGEWEYLMNIVSQRGGETQ
ncbi:DUF55-domain-containing protein [Biscogniauxia mediterranea]|nr:DUF55-domain-containing protein [Biscogniauxia mediterranea]